MTEKLTCEQEAHLKRIAELKEQTITEAPDAAAIIAEKDAEISKWKDLFNGVGEECDQLRTENARLTQERDEATSELKNGAWPSIQTLQNQVASLTAERDAAKANEERFYTVLQNPGIAHRLLDNDDITADEFIAAIDALRGKEGE